MGTMKGKPNKVVKPEAMDKLAMQRESIKFLTYVFSHRFTHALVGGLTNDEETGVFDIVPYFNLDAGDNWETVCELFEAHFPETHETPDFSDTMSNEFDTMYEYISKEARIDSDGHTSTPVHRQLKIAREYLVKRHFELSPYDSRKAVCIDAHRLAIEILTFKYIGGEDRITNDPESGHYDTVRYFDPENDNRDTLISVATILRPLITDNHWEWDFLMRDLDELLDKTYAAMMDESVSYESTYKMQKFALQYINKELEELL